MAIKGNIKGTPIHLQELGDLTALARAFDGLGSCEVRSRRIRVADCGPARVVAAVSHLGDDEVEASVIHVRGLSQPIDWVFDFGDGTRVATKDRSVRHRYKQGSFTEPRVFVHGTGSDGTQRTGHALVDFPRGRDDIAEQLYAMDREMEALRDEIRFVAQ